METTDQLSRQAMGCGYEPPPLVEIHVAPPRPRGFMGELTTCPGFTTKLPQVVEASRARLHWGKGALASFCRGEPAEQLERAIEVLEVAVQDVERALMTPVKDGGLRDP